MQETQEVWVWSLGQEDPLEEEMATHSSVLAWKSPWTKAPGRLQCTEWTRLSSGAHKRACPPRCFELPGFLMLSILVSTSKLGVLACLAN